MKPYKPDADVLGTASDKALDVGHGEGSESRRENRSWHTLIYTDGQIESIPVVSANILMLLSR